MTDESITKLSTMRPHFVSVLTVTDGVRYNAEKSVAFNEERQASEKQMQKLFTNITGVRACGVTNRCHGDRRNPYNPNSWDAYVFRTPLPRLNWYSLRPAIYMNQFGAENAAGGTLIAAGLTPTLAMKTESVLCNPCPDITLRHFHCSRKKMHIRPGRIYIDYKHSYPGAKVQVRQRFISINKIIFFSEYA